MAAVMPPINIQTALSVGEPVKNLDTSELKEFVALIPKIMSNNTANEQSKRNDFIHMFFSSLF
jgi:hypothetical protein